MLRTARARKCGEAILVLVLGLAVLTTALFGLSVEGATRWVRVSSLSVQVSLVVLPAMLVSFAHCRTGCSTVGIVLAALALALQPDRAMAGILAAALAVLAVCTKDPRVLITLIGAAIGFATTLLRPDNLPAVPYVDQILYTAFDVGVLTGLAVTLDAFLLVVPALLGWRHEPDHRHVYAIFGVICLGALVAAALGNYPTRVAGYGGSAILGYALSLSLVPTKLLRLAIESRAGDDVPVEKGNGTYLRRPACLIPHSSWHAPRGPFETR